MTIPQGFLEALPYPHRSPEIPEQDDIFSPLIGSWGLDAVLYDATGQGRKIKGELHVCWVLEGRAIQDLFIYPRRVDQSSGVPAQGDRYATTIRTYNRGIGTWRVNFINPAAPETSAELIARRDGANIAMDGKLSDGTSIRWKYAGITSTEFHYTAEKALVNENSWHIYLELFGKRISTPGPTI